MTNPLLEQHELPPFDRIRPGDVVPAIETLIAENRRTIADLLDAGAHTWEELFRVIEELEDRLAQAFSPVSHLNAVLNSEQLREAYEQCLLKLSEYSTEIRQNPRLFDAYKRLAASPEYVSLDKAARKSIDNAIRDFKLAGVDLGKAEQKKFADINKRLSALSSKFSNNVLDATMAWSRLIKDAEELKGLPASTLALGNL